MENCLSAEDPKNESLELWMSEYGTSLLRMCFLYLKDIQLAEDVVQETMVKAYFQYEDFRNQSSVKTWLTRIAINKCKDYRRSSWFQRVKCMDILSETIETERETEDEDEVENQVVKLHKNKDLIAAVLKLPVKYREVILLYYYQELSTKETADILAVPEGTVSTRLRRARTSLKKELGGWYYDQKHD